MKIVLATGIFPPDIGGPATYTERLALELEKRGLEVKIITYSDGGSFKSEIRNPEGEPLVPYGAGPKSETNSKYLNSKTQIIRISRRYPKIIRHFLYFWRLLWLTGDADVLYAQNSVSAGLPAMLASKILRKRLILKVVGDAAWESYVKCQMSNVKCQKFDNIDEFQNKKHSFATELMKKIEKLVVRSASKIIAPSFYLKNIITNWGVPVEKINVIYNAAEPVIGAGISKEEAKKKIGIEGNIILSIGRLSPWKGFGVLIDIMPDLIKENPFFKLIIVGEGEEKENLKLQIVNCKLENNVKLVDKVSHRDIPSYFKAADVFILNSEYEGLSHVLLEAMQFGTSAVASNKGGNPELIEDNFNGFLTEYNDKEQLKNAILRLRRDKELQENFIRNSLEKVKKFSWENLVEKTLNVLNST